MCSLVLSVLSGWLAPFLSPILQSSPPLSDPRIADPKLIACGNASFADFDLDGVADIALTNSFLQLVSGPFAVLHLDESGQCVRRTVGPMTASVFALYKSSVAVDANGDGLPDLVTTNSQGQVEIFANGGPTRLRTRGQRFHDAVLLDDLAVNLVGTRTFVFPVMFCADLDKDGYQDIVLAGQIQRLFLPTLSCGLNVYFGDATGLFSSRAFEQTGLVVAGRTADFNRDGLPEIVLLTESGLIHHFHCYGKQLTPSIPVILPFSWKVTSMDVGDVDRDGVPDYLFAGDPGKGKLSIAIGTQTAGLGKIFSLAPPAASVPDEITAARLFDLDSDNKLDVVALQAFGSAGAGKLIWYQGGGDGTFANAVEMKLPGTLNLLNGVVYHDSLDAVDVNRDGNQELVVTTLLTGESSPAMTAVFPNRSRSQCAVEHFGTGATGSGDFRPRIGVAGGAPLTGRKDFAITLTDARGSGTCAALLCGVKQIQFEIGYVGDQLTLYTEPRFVSMHWTRGTGAGGGFLIVPCPVPDDPAIVGLNFFFQWILDDKAPARPIGLTTSDALRVVPGRRNP